LKELRNLSGTYYPLFKIKKPESEPVVNSNKNTASPEPVLRRGFTSPTHERLSAEQHTLAIFITASLAIVGLRIKKYFEEKRIQEISGKNNLDEKHFVTFLFLK
jgi:hypothetical protein